MSKCFAGGHLRYVDGAWRDDNGYAVEIEPVRHGEWEYPPIGMAWCYVCSECGEPNGIRLDDYCPNCGAKMDGAEKE